MEKKWKYLALHICLLCGKCGKLTLVTHFSFLVFFLSFKEKRYSLSQGQTMWGYQLPFRGQTLLLLQHGRTQPALVFNLPKSGRSWCSVFGMRWRHSPSDAGCEVEGHVLSLPLSFIALSSEKHNHYISPRTGQPHGTPLAALQDSNYASGGSVSREEGPGLFTREAGVKQLG